MVSIDSAAVPIELAQDRGFVYASAQTSREILMVRKEESQRNLNGLIRRCNFNLPYSLCPHVSPRSCFRKNGNGILDLGEPNIFV